MAKIRGFLKGAKGKIGDFVVQKGEKATILRANNGVSNPQSAAQMAQRVAFATATNAAKKMLSVIGLSFYGVSDGKLSRRKFVALNVPILKASADAQLADETEQSNPKCFFKAKDINQLVPNPYIVSDGSLVLPEQWAIQVNENTGLTIFDGGFDFSSPKEAKVISGAQLIEALFGVTTGEQITMVSILGKEGDSVAYEYENGATVTVNGVPVLNYDWMRFTRMFAPRLVFKQQDFSNLEIVADETSETLLPKLKAAVRGCIDMDKSSEDFVTLITNALIGRVQDANIVLGVDAISLSNDLTISGWKMHAAGIVRSANVDGVWDFTRTQLVVNMDTDTAGGPEDNLDYSGLNIGTAIYTYVGVADASNKNFMTTGTPFAEMPQQ